jgi:[acyl-carrier-protein] S-malonyltransferase
MSGRLLILCPGQGSQNEAMFDLARTDARAAAFIEQHAPAFTAAGMFDNKVAQPLIVAATLAMWEALRDRVDAPALAAGYSIGELAAYGVSGAFTPAQAVALAATRARLMDEAATAHPGQAMLSVSGLAIDKAGAIAQSAAVDIAIVTGEDSCIVGGERARLDIAEAKAVGQGARCQLLPVAVASHTRLMVDAVAPFARELDAATFSAPLCPVLSGIEATRIQDKAQARDHLSRQLARTIQWSACMDAALEAGVTVALELGPGASLSRMFRTRYPDLPCRSASEFRTLDGIASWLERQLD